MAYWLVKSEPFKYSWDQFEKEGQTYWNGVRNYAARNHLKAMQKGDKVLFYHSNEGLEIVGIAQVVKEHYQDPTTDEPAWVVVDLKPVKKTEKSRHIKTNKGREPLSRYGIITIEPLVSSAGERRRMECDYGACQ